MNPDVTQLMTTLQSKDCEFGAALRIIREAQNISLRKMAYAISKTPAYISDVECGNTRPPNQELLAKILNVLSLDDGEAPLRGYLFDLAAKQRGEAPGDILNYIMDHEELRNTIRLAVRKGTKDDFWTRCAQNL